MPDERLAAGEDLAEPCSICDPEMLSDLVNMRVEHANATAIAFGRFEAFRIRNGTKGEWGIHRTKDPCHTFWAKEDKSLWTREEAVAEAKRLSESDP